VTWLALLPSGSRAVVSALPASRGLAKRLIALGLTPGAEIGVLQNRGRGPLIIEVHGCRLAVGWGQAARVAVEPLPADAGAIPPKGSEVTEPVCLSEFGEPGGES
jgi:ferrous iron transport protein A